MIRKDRRSTRFVVSPVVVMGILAISGCTRVLPTSPSGSPISWTHHVTNGMDLGWSLGLPGVGNHLYIIVANGIAALDKNTGTEVWRNHAWTGQYYPKNLAVGPDRICAAADWDVGCYSTGDGRVIWSIPLRDTPGLEKGGAFTAHTVLDQNHYYVGFNDGRIIAFDLDNGSQSWITDVVPEERIMVPIYGLLLSNDTLFIVGSEWIKGSGDQSALAAALDAKTGKLIWRYNAPTHSGFIGAPLLFRGHLLVSDTYGRKIRALSTATGTEVWVTEAAPGEDIRPENGPTARGDLIVVGSNDGWIYTFQWPSRKVHWKTRLVGAVKHAVPCGEKVVAQEYQLHLANLATGKLITSVDDATDRFLLPGDFIVSQIAVEGNHAYVMGRLGVYKVNCD